MNDKDSKLIFEQYLKNISESKKQFTNWDKNNKEGTFGDFDAAATKKLPPVPGAGAPQAHALTSSSQASTTNPGKLAKLKQEEYRDVIEKCPRKQLIDGTFTKAEKQAIALAVSSNYMENAFAPMGASNIGLVPIYKAASSLNPLLLELIHYNRQVFFKKNIDTLNPEIDESKLNAFRSGALKYIKNLAKFIIDNYDKIFFIGTGKGIPTGRWKQIGYHTVNKQHKNHNIQQLKSIIEHADKIKNINFISFVNSGKDINGVERSGEGKELDIFSNEIYMMGKTGRRKSGAGIDKSNYIEQQNKLNAKF